MKNGTIFLICVLLTVLAIPLFADLVLVNTVDEALSNSSINSEEVNFTEQELFDMHIAVLAVGLCKKDYFGNRSKMSALAHKSAIKTDIKLEGRHKHCGGVHRIKSGRH